MTRLGDEWSKAGWCGLKRERLSLIYDVLTSWMACCSCLSSSSSQWRDYGGGAKGTAALAGAAGEGAKNSFTTIILWSANTKDRRTFLWCALGLRIFLSGPCARRSVEGAQFIASAPRAENPSYATGSRSPADISSIPSVTSTAPRVDTIRPFISPILVDATAAASTKRIGRRMKKTRRTVIQPRTSHRLLIFRTSFFVRAGSKIWVSL